MVAGDQVGREEDKRGRGKGRGRKEKGMREELVRAATGQRRCWSPTAIQEGKGGREVVGQGGMGGRREGGRGREKERGRGEASRVAFYGAVAGGGDRV